LPAGAAVTRRRLGWTGALLLLATTAAAQGTGPRESRGAPTGAFDFWVLALSWSPGFCEATGSGRGREQCELGRQLGFVVHGLWPQYERGFPEYCQRPSPRLDRNIMTSMLDLMPAPGLIFNEWDKHGTCSGLNPRAYFDNVRKARAVVKIPEQYLELKEPLAVTPDEVEDAFIKANPGLTRAGVAVTCDSKRMSEVRICVSREFGFRDCPDIDRRACRRDKLVMPPVRGG
jgi:ribonuclease T2